MSLIRTNSIQTTGGKPILQSTGSILQVVTSNITTSYTLSATTETIIYNPAIAITPTSTTSLIFFDIQMFAYNNGANDFYTSLWLRRNSLGAAISSSQNGSWGEWTRNWGSESATAAHKDFHWSCWDIPGTTNSVNYLLTGLNHQASRSFILWHSPTANNARQMQITAFEVSR